VEEKQLVADIRNDPSKFSVVFDTYYSVIFSYIFRRVADYDLARDIASETFLKAFLNIGTFRWRGISISFWLYRIATNEMHQFFRKKKYQPESLEFLVETYYQDIIDPASTKGEKMQLENEIQQHADFLIIQKKIKQLPVIYQEVLALRYFEQKSIKEVAAILDKREGTVKSLLSRGIEKLKKML